MSLSQYYFYELVSVLFLWASFFCSCMEHLQDIVLPCRFDRLYHTTVLRFICQTMPTTLELYKISVLIYMKTLERERCVYMLSYYYREYGRDRKSSGYGRRTKGEREPRQTPQNIQRWHRRQSGGRDSISVGNLRIQISCLWINVILLSNILYKKLKTNKNYSTVCFFSVI